MHTTIATLGHSVTYDIDAASSDVSLTNEHFGRGVTTVHLPVLSGSIEVGESPFASSAHADLDGSALTHPDPTIWSGVFPGIGGQPLLTLKTDFLTEHDGAWSVIATLAGAGRKATIELFITGVTKSSDQLWIRASGHFQTYESDSAQISASVARRTRVQALLHGSRVSE